MPEEIEVPTEHLKETIEHAAHGAHGGHGHEAPAGPSWIMQVALSSALIAVLAAISALLAGHHANEAMLSQMKATDQWAYYQAKGIKSNVLKTKMDILEAIDKKAGADDVVKLGEYGKEQKEIEEKAKSLEEESEAHMHRHVVLARSVTTFQVAIALAAIAVLTKKRLLWILGVGLGLVGAFFMVQGLM